MIHHVIYFQLQENAQEKVLEEMVRASRSWLLKVPEVLSVRSGRNVDPDSQWQFFYAIEVESREKLKFTLENPFFLKFDQTYIQPNIRNSFGMDFELDPSRDLKYS